jgi:hypothetical protein
VFEKLGLEGGEAPWVGAAAVELLGRQPP